MAKSKNSTKSFPELRIEDCVDDGIDTRVDVSQHGGCLEGQVSRRCVEGVFYTQGVQNIAGEKWNPANQECGYNGKNQVLS